MDWLGKMIGLPEEFLHTHRDSTGGGVIQVGNLVHYPIFLLSLQLWRIDHRE